MKVVNSWLGRRTAPPLVMFLIATTCHASALVNFPETPESTGISSSLISGVSYASSYQVAGQADPASVPPQQTTPSPATSQTAPASAADAASKQTNQVPAQTVPTQTQQTTTPNTQTSPAPIVRTPAVAPLDSQSAPMPPATQNGQQTTPGTNQPYTGDQQYSTPAATQQLNRHPLDGQPTAAPAPEPSAPPAPPVGTAVAPAINARGTAGSRVAGAAVAPAKQRRIRIIAIRAALIVGAAVAIGVVVAASKASPARAH